MKINVLTIVSFRLGFSIHNGLNIIVIHIDNKTENDPKFPISLYVAYY